MPEPLTQYNSDMWAAYNSLQASMLTFRNYFYSLGDQILAQNWAEAKNVCYNLADYYGSTVTWRLCNSGGIKGKTYASLHWIDDNWPSNGNGEVSMDSILTAMLGAEFDELQKFVGLVDAYRVAIWNAPFNAELYAALARGFSTWPQF